MVLARNGHDVSCFTRTPDEAQIFSETREHRFLPGVSFPDSLTFTGSPSEAFAATDLALVVVPSSTIEQNIGRVAPELRRVPLIVSAIKGIAPGSGHRATQRISDSLDPTGQIGAISGPNLAREIADSLPSSATVAFADRVAASAAQEALSTPRFRVYSSDDVLGVELGGALKNVIAIGAGIIDGLRIGDNGKAAFISRGLAEITRLGVAMGARPETFAGLSGMGDLVATCYSGLSRNRHVGELLASGKSTDQILSEMDQVAEGVHTTQAVIELAESHGVDMPIAQLTGRVLYEGVSPAEALEMLMNRAPAPETRR
jgi:glycerol-3-phosphate dehydrogenase (NAD(P)+)